MAAEMKCVVCGMGSTRDDWQLKATVNGKLYVACDDHKPEEFKAKLPAIVKP